MLAEGLREVFVDSGSVTEVCLVRGLEAAAEAAVARPDAFVIEVGAAIAPELPKRLGTMRRCAPRAKLVLLCSGRDTEHRLQQLGEPVGVTTVSVRSGTRELMEAVGIPEDQPEEEKVARIRPLPAPVRSAVPLTARERDVLEHVSRGLTTAQIGRLLGISTKTIDNHKQRIYMKLEVQSQAHAVAVAVRMGLINPGFSHAHAVVASAS